MDNCEKELRDFYKTVWPEPWKEHKRINLAIHGRPTTKKNSSRVWNNRVHPSKAFEEFENMARIQLIDSDYNISDWITLECKYWMPDRRSWPDLVGLLQATSDVLQSARVIKDDKQVVSYGHSLIAGIDKENPRTEIVIITHDTPPWEKELK